MITWGRIFWPVYLVVVSVAFLAPEIYALVTNAYNTLSDYAWRELNVTMAVNRAGYVHTAAWWVSIIAWLLAAGVLTAHIWFRVSP